MFHSDAMLLAASVIAGCLAVAVLALLVQLRGSRHLLGRAEDEFENLRDHAEALRDRLGAAERQGAAMAAEANLLRPLRGQIELLERALRQRDGELAARDGRAEAEREAFEQRQADLLTIRGEMERDFKNLATNALGESRQSFLALADEVFKKHRAETGADVELRRKAVEDLVRPIGDALKLTQEKLQQIEKERTDSFGQIREQLGSVGRETARLTQALKANPGTRGRWGEESLRNALELAGLSAHCDFDTQATFARLDSSIRPDCVIHLPGGRHIVVDAKTPISAFLEGVEATDEATRTTCMKRHADAMRQHMLSLARKEYAQTVSAHMAARPDFVAMYVPGENFFAAAIERNGDLFSEAIGKGVFIVTPTTLIALAKAIALGWQQEAITENAREVAELGRELYARICKMGDHVAKVGRGLDAGVKAFNSFVGSMETSVMPQARRFKDLHVADGSKSLDLLEPIEAEVRDPVRGRDLLFEERPALAAPIPAG
ncbi:DNA recombination protein RmuC [Faunimonas pinastri]|uniref:DNA recombination protein RmuC homolog n=1 Tax=Faunimonas pinastri TaxID=1855383 RepID=A0A1H9HFZ1_9HYPH|nr:DNA recombination protein RmuC [Faunimonas pinastri]SEQ61235.1 DNA recombination protein RmuC [Faunimonas pinastri]